MQIWQQANYCSISSSAHHPSPQRQSKQVIVGKQALIASSPFPLVSSSKQLAKQTTSSRRCLGLDITFFSAAPTASEVIGVVSNSETDIV
jgi:hypothetical protein